MFGQSFVSQHHRIEWNFSIIIVCKMHNLCKANILLGESKNIEKHNFLGKPETNS